MKLTVRHRHPWEDITLLASTDRAANKWQLERNDGNGEGWWRVTAVIRDAHMNWDTTDLSLWEGLREGEPDLIRQYFPEATRAVPVGVPFVVSWSMPDWYDRHPLKGKPPLTRFISPNGTVFEFSYDEIFLGTNEHTFG